MSNKIFIQSIQGVVKAPKSCDRNESYIKVMDEQGNPLPWYLGRFIQDYLDNYIETCKLNLPDGFNCESVGFYLSNPDTDLEKIISKRIGFDNESNDEYFEGDFIYGEISLEDAKKLNKGVLKWY